MEALIGSGSSSTVANFLFPTLPSYANPPSSNIEVRSFFNRTIEGNEEQKRAVRQIVNGGIPGVPYIIFGPPGTGKTVTMVEAIKQVLKFKPKAKILATAPSNSATDVLASRIMENIPA